MFLQKNSIIDVWQDHKYTSVHKLTIKNLTRKIYHNLNIQGPSVFAQCTVKCRKWENLLHICELTRIKRVSPAFQTTYPHKRCWSISLGFVLSHSPKNHFVGNKSAPPLSQLIVTLLISNNDLAITLAI